MRICIVSKLGTKTFWVVLSDGAVFSAMPNLEQRRHSRQVVNVLSCRQNVDLQASAVCEEGNKKRLRKVLELKSSKKHGIYRVSWHP